MHGSAETLAQAVRASVDFGHHGLGVAAEHHWIPMAAIGGERGITGAEVAQRTDDRRLGAVGEMRMAANHAGMVGEGALHALFEFADAQHLSVDPYLPFGVRHL